MKTKTVKLVPNEDLQNQLYNLVGNRKVLHIVCELNHIDKLKIKGQIQEAAKQRRKPIYCETNGKAYKSISQAAIELILSPGNISKVCYGKRSNAGGYKFRFGEE